MDQTQTRWMGVLATLLGLVTAALWWFDAPGVDEDDPNAVVEIWKLEADDLARIDIARADGRVVLAREGERWRVVEPETFDADPDRVRGLVSALTSIERGVPIEGDDPEEFGLGASPVATVTVTPREGEARTLVFGNVAPVGWSTYAKTADGRLVAVPGRPQDDLTAGTEHWRDRRIFQFDPADVTAVTLTGPEGTLTVRGVPRADPPEGTPPRSWWLEGFTRADPDVVDDLVTGLLMLRFEEITPQAPVLENPLRTARIETTDAVWTLRVGESDGSFAPAEVEGGLSGTVLGDALAVLGMGPGDLGDSRAFPYDPDHTDRIEIAAGDRRWIAIRNGSAWEIDGEVSQLASDVASAVDGAAIAYTREPVPPPATIAFSVILGEGKGQSRVDVGPAGGELATARDAAGGESYRVPEQDLAALRKVVAP
jgi:hypothetical protein